MRIDSCSFGQITVAGTQHTTDILVFPDKVQSNWWREEGHRLDMQDLTTILEAGPKTPVIGTGHYGHLEVPLETRNRLLAYGIQVHAAPTPQAVTLFNSMEGTPGLVGAFHLTC
ncbi:MAG: Mth938-like domain-containing protein [Planctomycetota bacterium]|jgi:hypothetical protein